MLVLPLTSFELCCVVVMQMLGYVVLCKCFRICTSVQGMVITETKRQMHETLELKEEEIAQLRSRIKQMTTQGEELQEQKEKSERAGKNTGLIFYIISQSRKVF